MKEWVLAAAAVSAPSFGPSIVTLFGTDVPVLALCTSLAGVVLARIVSPASLRRLSWIQHIALTLLLLLMMFALVAGFQLGVGMATVMGVGLGLSGMVAVEMVADRALASLSLVLDRMRAAVRAAVGGSHDD